MVFTSNASVAWKALNGVVCIYKPTRTDLSAVRALISSRICDELNQMSTTPPNQMVEIVGDTNAPMKVKLVTDLTSHVLVSGPRYQNNDIRLNFVNNLYRNTSGVCLIGLNNGTRLIRNMDSARLTRCFKVHGQLGKATDTYFADGKVVEKVSFKHVTRERIDRTVSYIQSMHQKKMFELCGVDMNSQTGYELATRGLLRPADKDIPVLYGIKCVHFQSPDFILEVQCVNEYEKYLHTLIHDIGVQLRTASYCTQVHCIRHGMFTTEHALLKKHWTLQNILNSIDQCRKIINENKFLIQPDSPELERIDNIK